MSNGVKPPVTIQYRRMSVPSETQTLGVKTDVLSEMVEFQVPKYYTGFDLSDKAWFVDTLNDNGQIFDRKALASYPSADTNVLSLWWVVGRLPSSASGTVRVRLVAFGEDFLWQTEPAQFRIADTFIEATPSDPPGISYFDNITLLVSQHAIQAQESARQALDAAGEADGAREAAEQSALAAANLKQEVEELVPATMTESAYAALLAAGQAVAGKLYYTVPDGTPGV